MSNYEQFARSPMCSRRVRRHAQGVSNAHSMDDSASSISRSTVSLIHADRVVKVPKHLRPADPAARETRVEDRPVVTRVHDKLFKTHRERFVLKVLRSCCGDGSGLLTAAQLRTALDRLHVGLEREERDRIVARVAPDEDSKVHYLEFMRVFEIPQPLGDEAVATARGMSVPGPPIVRPGGGGSGVGDGGTSHWNWQRHAKGRMPGLLGEVREGSAEQAASDALLTGLLATKLGNCRDKLRAVFRRMDADRNSLIDREEFARGIAALRIDVSREQVDRLFDITDTDRNGLIDYTEFAESFGGPVPVPEAGRKRWGGGTGSSPTTESGFSGTAGTAENGFSVSGGSSSAVPLDQSLALSQDEVYGALRQPLVLELARSLHGKGGMAVAPFRQLDLPRCGALDVRGMTTACRALVPGIGERQVAAVMAALDPDSTGHVDYRAFVSRLMEGALTHPRLAHSAPPGGKAGKATDAAGGSGSGGGGGGYSATGALARFGETLTVPEALPTPHTRALSAVSLSRRNDGAAADLASTVAAGGSGASAAPPPPSSVSPDRDSLYKIHTAAIMPLLDSLDRAAATASVDLGSLARSQQRWLRDDAATSSAASGSKAPSHATGRFSRFWSKRYVDTTSITSADPASSQYTGSEGAFVRKGANADFLAYQAADRAREARRREQHGQRYATRSEVDSRYSAQDDASGTDAGRLTVAQAMRERYEERCEMYDRLRQMQDKSDHTFFGRLPVFREHKSDTANLPVRADQTRVYW